PSGETHPRLEPGSPSVLFREGPDSLSSADCVPVGTRHASRGAQSSPREASVGLGAFSASLPPPSESPRLAPEGSHARGSGAPSRVHPWEPRAHAHLSLQAKRPLGLQTGTQLISGGGTTAGTLRHSALSRESCSATPAPHPLPQNCPATRKHALAPGDPEVAVH
ncbi:hypothetical protein H1C71_031036, partial [Ictidomys tridecemlineatus]